MTFLVLFSFFGSNTILVFSFLFIMLINLATIVYMIFWDKRSPQKTLLWLVTILTLPITGFIFYLYLGKGPSIGKKKKLLKKIQTDHKYREELIRQADFITKFDTIDNVATSELIHFNIEHNDSICTFLNDVKLYNDIKKHYEDMLYDLRNAKESINFQYFIIKPDNIGRVFRDTLIQKAREGVEVRVVYDDFGSIKIKKAFFKELRRAGGKVARFFPSFFRVISRNVNYRNHRKIVVIDRKIAYTGGSNIGEEYISMHSRITPWRDTHLRLVGRSVDMLNIRFMQDFNFAAGSDDKVAPQMEITTNNILPVQVVSSGPDEPKYGIEKAYIKAIYSARKRVFIQSPYLVPSCCLMNALKTAAQSGVEVRLMIPKVPDKIYAYYCTTSYAKELVESGIKVYMWNGFIHSKTLLIDDQISSVGTVNMDYRSFNLHFEVTTFIYDEVFGTRMREVFEEDLKNSTPFDSEYIKNRPWYQKFLERVLRLFSSLM